VSIRVETLVAELPFLAPLRPDELYRATKRFRIRDMAPGETCSLGESGPEAVLLISGHLTVEVVPLEGEAPVRSHLLPGDHVGVLALFVGSPVKGTLHADSAVRLGLLDAAAYAALEEDFPVLAIPVCAELAEELARKDELLREVASIATENLSGEELEAALRQRRARVAARLKRGGSRIVRRAAAWGDRLKSWAREPAFLMLAGFLAAFLGARTMVHYIVSHHKEKTMFALRHVEGFENPVHIHHFNYGLILVTITSLLSFFPAFRQHIRTLALIFGVGAGLIFDEFGLIWNFNPDYYQAISWIAVALVTLVLAQLAFRREAWTRRLRRIAHRKSL
jgi:CRP-like cAMP-binding protein